MSESSAPGAPAARGLLGILRSWLRWGAGERWPSPADLSGIAAELHSHPSSSLRVLVVDDNPVNLMVISSQLASKGVVPLLAADGGEAVALACEMQFDLILMDLQMPILDGLNATAAIRRFESSSSRPPVPVVAYSSLLPGDRVLAAHGIDGSLVKPCDDQDLERCLVRWCPTYHPAPTGHGAPRDNGRWPAAGFGSNSAPWR